MNLDEAHPLATEVMDRAEIAVVATVGQDGYPVSRAMYNLRRAEQFPGLQDVLRRLDQPFGAWFSTGTTSPKVRHIVRNPHACVYYPFADHSRGLTIKGDLHIVTEPEIRHQLWQEDWERDYPLGPDDPDYTILRLVPTMAHYYHQLQFATFDLRPGLAEAHA